MDCSEAEEGVHENCCLHELPASSKHAPGTICCWCGDIYLPFDTAACSQHGEYLPAIFKKKVTKRRSGRRA